jgi:uracil-DNA glycosylase
MADDDGALELAALARRIRACRICVENPRNLPLPHEPRPVFRVSSSARLLVASQAPGVKVHMTGPMGFCFPGHDANKGDLPPRPECRATWHDLLFSKLPQIECVLAIGRYAQAYHFGRAGRPLPKGLSVDETIRRWREFAGTRPKILALPHPSWRNNGWIKRNSWFESDVLPALREEVARALS